ncbi:MAG: VWA domain-containing protein [Parachlamydiaceae bacterium]|nr:VWA domain-containing protein [Parachlamydiaceae bacterium]
MSDFHFLRPHLLLLMIPLGALLAYLIYVFGSKGNWSNICSKELLPYVLVENVKRKSMLKLLPFVTLSLLILALAGPSWKEIPRPLIKSESGLIIALDLSPTMDAEDIKPSRLKRALYKVNDLLSARKEGQTALLVFSGDPFIVTPLTDDIETIKALLPALDTKIMPSAGHDVSKAVIKAKELFNQAGLSQGTLLLITSELKVKDLEKSINFARESGIKISILGVGTNENAPISKPGGGFLTDKKGAMVIAKLEKDNLAKLAKSTGGVYVSLAGDDTDIHDLNSQFSVPDYSSSEDNNKNKNMQTQWLDEGYWLVFLALPFVSLLFRRGILLSVLFLIPQTLQAFTWDSLWSTPDQQAEKLFHEEKYEDAKEKFQNSDWLAATNYKLGDYKAAASLFNTNKTIDGLYNFGTAKAKQGDFKKALKAYDALLKEQPDHEDTLYNKKLIEEHLKQQEQQKQENQENKENKENKEKQENQAQNKEEEQKKDQEKEKNSAQDQNSQQQNNSDGESSEDGDRTEQQQQNEAKRKDADKKDMDKTNHREKELDQLKTSPEEQPEKDLQEKYSSQVNESLEKKTDPQEEKAEIASQEKMDEQKEQREIDDRWLNRVHDDPGGLLRRKFLYQYKTKGQN